MTSSESDVMGVIVATWRIGKTTRQGNMIVIERESTIGNVSPGIIANVMEDASNKKKR